MNWVKKKKWKEIGQDKKSPIKILYQELYYNLFKDNREYQICLYDWFNSRQSDLKCVGSEIFVPEKKILSENPKIEKLGDDSIQVGHYKLRVKSSSGRVRNTWKINWEIIQQ